MGTTPNPVPTLASPIPGAVLQFTATPNPDGTSFGNVVVQWASSDASNVSIVTDATGQIATVTLGANIPVGEVVTLNAHAGDPDSAAIAKGSIQFTVLDGGPPPPPPPTFPTDIIITQTA